MTPIVTKPSSITTPLLAQRQRVAALGADEIDAMEAGLAQSHNAISRTTSGASDASASPLLAPAQKPAPRVGKLLGLGLGAVGGYELGAALSFVAGAAMVIVGGIKVANVMAHETDPSLQDFKVAIPLIVGGTFLPVVGACASTIAGAELGGQVAQ